MYDNPRRFKFTRVLLVMVNGRLTPCDCTLDVILFGQVDERKIELVTARTEEGLGLTIKPLPAEPPHVINQGIFITKDHPTHTVVETAALPREYEPGYRAADKSSLLGGTNLQTS